MVVGTTKFASAVVTGAVLASFGMPAYAQFGNLLKQLQEAAQQIPQGAPQPPGATPAPSGGGSLGFGGGASRGKPRQMAPDDWCREQAGSLEGVPTDNSVIASEFKIQNLESLQDLFFEALSRTGISKTFPDARFFAASFETAKVRAIYDSFLSFPEPDTLAALIHLSRSGASQHAGDASMALLFLHLQAPNLSANPNRSRELIAQAVSREHWTSKVFSARVHAFGEYARKDLGVATGELVNASTLRSDYSRNDGGVRREFDTENYELIHTDTARRIFENEPNMPFRAQWAEPARMAAQIEAAQKAYASRFPSTRIGRITAEVVQVNKQSIEVGNEIIRSTQGGNQLVGQIASLKSLQERRAGDRDTIVDMDPATQAAQLRMFAKVGDIAPEQRANLARAQELRYTAQGMLATSRGELLAHLLNQTNGGLISMAASLPALSATNAALIQSCQITVKWEQAMRARDVPAVDKTAVATTVGSRTKQYTD